MGSRRERNEDRRGGGVDAFISSSNCNLTKYLILIERETGDDVRTSLAFALLLRRGELVKTSVESDGVNKKE